MDTHEYTPEDALRLLLGKLRKYPDLYAQVQEAIDAGKDTPRQLPEHHDTEGTQVEMSAFRPQSRRDKPHEYRKLTPFSVEEALDVAALALQANFVEQPLFVNGIMDNLNAGGGIEVDVRTETQSIDESNTAFKLNRTSDNDLRIQKGNLDLLRRLIDFSGK